MLSLDRLEEFHKTSHKDDINKLMNTLISTNNTLLQNITNIDKELNNHDTIRNKINSLKIEKDSFIKQYIEETKMPDKLNIEYLNYKALLFYFLEHFTYEDMTLKYQDYSNNLSKISLTKRREFQEFFYNSLPIKINVQLSNFPHLIGYKDKYFDQVSQTLINQKSTKKEFIRNILYESNLTNDYEKDGCHTDKIEAFSWIISTLKKPIFIFDKDGIKPNSNLKADIIFIRKKSGLYHYVSLKKHLGSTENEYYINSHHHMSELNFRRKFYDNKIIYSRL
jgi:hypothetical protein